jgi:hypothetical protein
VTAHSDDHDPVTDHAECFECNARLRRAFNHLADMDLGPRDVDTLMTRLRELAGQELFPDLGWA